MLLSIDHMAPYLIISVQVIWLVWCLHLMATNILFALTSWRHIVQEKNKICILTWRAAVEISLLLSVSQIDKMNMPAAAFSCGFLHLFIIWGLFLLLQWDVRDCVLRWVSMVLVFEGMNSNKVKKKKKDEGWVGLRRTCIRWWMRYAWTLSVMSEICFLTFCCCCEIMWYAIIIFLSSWYRREWK